MLPVLFVSHGAPNLVLRDNAHTAFLRDLGASLPRPNAIVVLSAHWYAAAPRVGGAAHPATLHDFSGFPSALYAIGYPAPGDPVLAKRIADAIAAIDPDAEVDPGRGLDHGVWSPLSQMYLAADLPVVPVAIPQRWSASRLLELGQILKPFRDEGVLILGSGGLVHNLQGLAPPDSAPPPWAIEFAHWMIAAVRDDRREWLDDYRQRAPHAAQAHPGDDHLRPLFAVWGAANGGGELLHDGFDYGNLGMQAFAFWD